MKILHVNTEPSWRGGENQTLELIRHLPSDWDQTLACRKGSALHEKADSVGIRTIEFPFTSSIDLKSILGLARLLRTEKFDIVHCHTAKAHSLVYLASYFAPKITLIVTKRTVFPLKQNYLALKKYERTLAFVCISSTIERQVIASMSTPTCLIHSGVHIAPVPAYDIRTELALKKNTMLIGYVAALTSEKNPGIFLKTAEMVIDQSPDARFLWIGEGKERGDLQQQIDQRGLSEKVILVGAKYPVQPWVAGLDIFFFPSGSEGLGSSVLEAFVQETPVVSSNAGGLVDLVFSGKTGLSASPDDWQQLGSHILELIQNPQLRDELVEQAFAHAQSFTFDEMAKKHVALYEKLIRE